MSKCEECDCEEGISILDMGSEDSCLHECHYFNPLEKELATAKAENGRLLSVINEAHKVVYEVYEIVGIGQKAINGLWEVLQMLKPEGKALSSSNALDYWQGEIRKAKVDGIRHAAKLMRGMIRDGKEYSNDIIEVEASRQLNQSKGENLEPRGGG